MRAVALVDGGAVQRAVSRRLLPPLFCLALLCQLDRSNLAFAALQMDADLGFSRTVHGLGSGLFFIGYLAQIPSNMACVALGPRRWLPAILVCWGALAMCFAAVRNEAGFLVLRLLLGVAEAGAYPAIMYQLSLFCAPRDLGVAYTWVATATAVAGLLGAPLAAGLMTLDGAAGLRGWQWLFLLEGIPPILMAAALPLLLPSSPLTAGFLTPGEREWLWREVHGQESGIELVAAAGTASNSGGAADAGAVEVGAGGISGSSLQAANGSQGGAQHAALHAAAEAMAAASGEHAALLSGSSAAGGGIDSSSQQAAPSSSAPPGVGLSRAAMQAGLLDRRVWHLAAAMLLIDAAMNSCNFWLPSLVKAALQGELNSDGPAGMADQGSSELLIRSALLSALPFAGAAIAMVANAAHARRSNERRLHTVIPLLAASLGLAALPPLSAVGPSAALLAMLLVPSGIWATHGPFFSWPAAFLDKTAFALGFALMKTGGALGGFLGPFLVGAMADQQHGYTGAMLVLAAVAALAAALVFVFDDQK